ncbi:MAG: capsular biosynthesis protein [Deltaproteobacteria bacterium]|nr:capsular biosynthesis protein [Deltaproteobacteria bacterium]
MHCHILPGIDDGPKTVDDALAMCRIAVEDGIHTIVATPHCYKGRYANDASTILPAYELLQRRIREEGLDLNLQVAGDMHIDPDLPAFLKDNPPLCAGGRFVLVELPSESIPRFVGEFLFSLRVAGFTPILTHPERNRMIQRRPALVEEWIKGGTFMQVTAMSLTGEFGAEAQNAAFALLDRGDVHFVATDAHSATWRRPVLSKAAELLRGRVGEKKARCLVKENPHRILAGENPLACASVYSS